MIYREWQLLNQPNDNSDLVDSQLTLWLSFLDKREAALTSDREVSVFGDINLNLLTWNNPNTVSSSHTRRLQPLVTALFDRIMSHGVVQLVTEATRLCLALHHLV